MNIQYFIISKSSSIDQNSNLLSLFEVIEEINIKSSASTSAINIPVTCIACFNRPISQEKKISLSINFKLVIENEEVPIFNENYPIHFDINHARFRFRLNTQIPVSKTGKYIFQITESGHTEILAQYPINITLTN